MEAKGRNSGQNQIEGNMKTLKRQWTSIALIPLVLIMLVSIEKRIGAAPDQNQEATNN